MATRSLSVYLTPATMSAIRPGEALSARMNQIAMRYTLMVAHFERGLRAQFGGALWVQLGRAYGDMLRPPMEPLADTRTRLLAAIGAGDELAIRVDDLSDIELICLFELLEDDLAPKTPPATHS